MAADCLVVEMGRPGGDRGGVQGLRLGACEACLAVRQSLLSAEIPDQRLGTAQVQAGHGREQVVLDLVVQAAQR